MEGKLHGILSSPAKQNTYPPTPFLNQGTKTNDAIKEFQKIFQPRQKDIVESTRGLGRAVIRVNARFPIINENEIGAIVQKQYNNTVHNGEITHYYKNEKLYFLSYENGGNEKISQQQLNRYRCTDTDTDRDMTRRRTRLQTRLHQTNV